MKQQIKDFISEVEKANPNEPEFLQAVKEVAETVIPFIQENEKYQNLKLLERIVEPERAILLGFLGWMIREKYKLTRGYRVQFNSAIGPYKGGAPVSSYR